MAYTAEVFRSQTEPDMLEIRLSHFIPGLREDILTIQPRSHRRWYPEHKCWLIHEAHLQQLVDMLREREIEVYSPDLLGQSQSYDSRYAALYLLPDAPWEVVQAVYRVLARLYHPDTGGSTQRMVEINAAYAEIKNERGKQNHES